MKKILASAVVFLMLVSTTSFASQAADKEKMAVTAAKNWLALVDSGKYSKSWKQAAEYFRTAINPEQWEQSLTAVRKPLGAVISRKLKSATYKTSLPGAPDGEYIVIQFNTSFRNKKAAVETVTPMYERDGVWRVSGYFIK
jgi:hypothetical protein